MLFSSITFLYCFLPSVLILYFLVPDKFKNAVLLVSSLFFYGWGEPKLVGLMVITILVGYFSGLGIEKMPEYRKVILSISVMYCLGTLGYFKYAGFFLENIHMVTGITVPVLKIVLPIGISFYTFQILSYVIDVYRREVPAQKKLVYLAAYITMFPQLIAGPIVRYKDIVSELEHRKHGFCQTAQGIRRFVTGLAKKVLLANSFGELCAVFEKSGDKSILFFMMYAVGFSLQIYFDFSGYSDMAIGLGKIFGFEFAENFNYPYISKSITEFWRRWHISLGSWFRDYVYIPLGGSRVSKARWYFNIFVVWMLTGLWHGAAWNFVIWGLYFAVLLIIEKRFLLQYLEKSKVLGHIYVIVFVVTGFVIFDAKTISGNMPLVSMEVLYYLRSYAVLLCLGIIGSTPIPKKIAEKFSRMDSMSFGRKATVTVVEIILILAVLVVVTAYLVDGSFNPFLYFRF